jgi:hypothetical protein
MARYGGLGGLSDRRLVDQNDAFEMAVVRALGAVMKRSDALCADVWAALSNVRWSHENGDTASYSFRAAGDMIAAILEKGDYMDWYCSGTAGTVSPIVAEAMATEGWTSTPMP